jgi:hypothetical protein
MAQPLRHVYFTVFLISHAVASGAQTAPASTTELVERLKSGDAVSVTADGVQVKGKLEAASVESLVVTIAGKRQDIPLRSVTRVERERRFAKKGALIGLIAGAAVMPVMLYPLGNFAECDAVRGTIHACDDEVTRVPFLTLAGLLGAGIGTGAGAAIGATIKHTETLFSATAPSRRISVVPSLGPTGIRIQMALHF